jgi:hypothetical protein
MTVSNQIFPVVDADSPVAAFTVRRDLKAYFKWRLGTFINPLVYTFWNNQGTASIMAMSATLADG